MEKVGSAYWDAARTVMEMTHSCIEMPCFDILYMILNSWVSICIAMVVVSMYIQMAITAINSEIQRYRERKVQKKQLLMDKAASIAENPDGEYSVLMEEEPLLYHKKSE